MIIKLISEGVHGNRLAVSDNACENTDDLIVGNAVLAVNAMIAADHIIFFSHLEYTVKNVLTVRTLIKRYVVLFKSSIRSLDYHHVAVLSKERHHTRSYVRVNDLTVFL